MLGWHEDDFKTLEELVKKINNYHHKENKMNEKIIVIFEENEDRAHGGITMNKNKKGKIKRGLHVHIRNAGIIHGGKTIDSIVFSQMKRL